VPQSGALYLSVQLLLALSKGYPNTNMNGSQENGLTKKKKSFYGNINLFLPESMSKTNDKMGAL
jgi:hypothetical protein